MKHLLTATLAVFSCSCVENNDSIKEHSPVEQHLTDLEIRSIETFEMVETLQDLVTYGDPKIYPYWNTKNADLLSLELQNPDLSNFNKLWHKYCRHLLHAGNSRQCIAELEGYFDPSKPLLSQMTKSNHLLFEMLALAYLRAGEQENCQNLHTEFSCILPLQEPAFHQLPEGSSRAIQIYEAMYEYNPKDSYRWLINLGYMTLGEHPHGVPDKYLLKYPNWKMEQKKFPHFGEIAMNVNAAVNGLSGGVCLDDFNNDGTIDIFATNYDMSGEPKLLINNGKGAFEDQAVDAGIAGIVGGLNCIHADYDNDGYVDILILRGAWLGEAGNHPNSLLKNNGDGTFSDVTKSAGLLSFHPTQTAAWADYNRDGFLDLFIGNESKAGVLNPCELFKNNGNGTFTEVSKEAGLNDIMKFVKGVTWGDINNDSWPDLFISCSGKNLLYKNNKGRFEDISNISGIQDPSASFTCWFWDVNNDGFQDLYVSGYEVLSDDGLTTAFSQELQGEQSELSLPGFYLNNGDETFSNKTTEYNLNKSVFVMGANFEDIDNDGYLDFYLGTGTPSFEAIVPNRMFRNVGGKSFEEVTSAGGFGHIQKGHGIAFADIDQDGDQDIYAVMGGAFEGDFFTNVLFENPGFKNNWIIIELEGKTTNRAAIGTKIEVTLDNNRKVYRTVGTGGSFGSSSLQQEIGLGKAKSIKKIVIYWQNGNAQEFTDIGINQKFKLIEGSGDIEYIEYEYIPFNKGDGSHRHHH